MASTERSISFDADVLAAAERRVAQAGGDLSAFVNDAVRRELRLVSEPDPPVDPATLGEHRAGYLAALVDKDASRARAVVDAALAAGVPVIDIYTEVLAPSLHEVGHLWAADELNVAEEHFATAVTQSLLATLGGHIRVPPTEGRLAVVTGTPGELHLLGAQMVADLLEGDGWEVLCLGASTPAEDLVELVENECPDVVALSTSTAGRLPGVGEVLRRLGALDPRPLIVAGGGLYTEAAGAAARELGADLVLSDVRRLLAELHERFPPP